jgi:6-pyruvoyltetrahydropterin/6-carboxytetrahydropterin synthase
MFEVGVVTQFEAAHRLRGDFGPATRLHGHTYRVEVAARGRSLRSDGTLCDVGMLQQIVDEAIAPLHYQVLDELPAFAGLNTTAEVVACQLFADVAPRLGGQGIATIVVRVWESPSVYASYEGECPGSPAEAG